MRRHLTFAGPMVAALALAIASCEKGIVDGGTFTVNPPTADLAVGESVQLTAVGAPRAVVWSSSNSAIASVVPETGFVTAHDRGSATISAVAGSAVSTVDVTVKALPEILVAAGVIFDITDGDPDPAPVGLPIGNGGDFPLTGVVLGPIDYADGQPEGWLTAQLGGTPDSPALTLSAARGALPMGEYVAAVPVLAANAVNSPQSVLVTFRIVGKPSIALSREHVAVAGTPGSQVVEAVAVTNGGGRPLTGLTSAIAYEGGPGGWLQATLSGPTAPATLDLQIVAPGAVGVYVANVTIASSLAGVAARVVRVELSVTHGPAIQLGRNQVTFFAASQGPAPAAQTAIVTNGAGGSLTGLSLGAIQYAAGASGWLTAGISGSTAPATITLGVSPGQLATGTYTAMLPIASPVASNSPQSIQIALTIGPPPAIVATPASVAFGTFSGGSLPQSRQVAVTNSGGGSIAGLTAAIEYSGTSNWLTASWQGGGTTTPATLVLRPSTTALSRGTHQANVRVRSTTPGVADRVIPVTFTLENFDVDVYPLFRQQNVTGYTRLPCTQCHSEFNTANTAYSYLNTYSGQMICRISGGSGCGTSMLMPSSSVAKVQAWINAGRPR